MSIILPPPDIRTIIEKLAAYVVKNGAIFEEKILEKERQNPRFSFLYPSDPYHPYYQKRLYEYRQVGPAAVDDMLARNRESEQNREQIVHAPRASKKITKAPPKEPEQLDFLIELPAVSALDYDVMKLTALYVARNGRQFMFSLSQREMRNPQFDFLKPNHSLHGIFLRLVDQYSRVLLPSRALLDKLESDSKEWHQVLERILWRTEYTRYIREKQIKAEEIAEREKREYAVIDWHDFAVVETIEFGPADHNLELPKPLEHGFVASMSLVQRQELWNGNTMPGLGLVTVPLLHQEEEEMEMEMEVEETVYVAPQPTSQSESKKSALGSTTSPIPTGSHIKIRQDYVPKALGNVGAEREATEICSYCKLAFPKSQITEHMRIEALDPKWKEQKERHEAKYRDTNYATAGQDIFANLDSLNKTRARLSGMAEDDVTRVMSEASRTVAAGTVQYDGRADAESVGQATREAMRKAKPIVESQMAALQGKAPTNPGIGPQRDRRQ
jgi:splicing factor 3A subunit 1